MALERGGTASIQSRGKLIRYRRADLDAWIEARLDTPKANPNNALQKRTHPRDTCHRPRRIKQWLQNKTRVVSAGLESFMDNNVCLNDSTASVPAPDLTADDLAMFARLKIGPELLAAARVRRVTDAQARTDYAMRTEDARWDLAGILFPHMSPVTGRRTGARVPRDHHEIDENGKPKNKYIFGYGDPGHLYFPPGAAVKLECPDTPIVLVEAEKSALALTAWAERTGMDLLPLAMGGCWGWRGQRIRKDIAPNGEREDVSGPLPDLDYCDGRKVFVAMDANVTTNEKVAAARSALCVELREPRRKCKKVLVCELPVVDGANGPDDYIAVAGDVAMGEVFEQARPPQTQTEEGKGRVHAPLRTGSTGTLVYRRRHAHQRAT